MPTTPATAPPPPIVWLGYGGLIPFLALAAASLLGGIYAAECRHALVAYGAVILSFVGALHWGFAMTLPALPELRRRWAWVWSVVPALLAWVALLLEPVAAGLVLVVGFVAQYGQDRHLARSVTLPGWYLPLRLRLTAIACVSLIAGAVAHAAPLGSPAAIASAASSRAADATRATSPAPLYVHGTPSRDGIGKFYHGREIAKVMGYEGAPWLDRPAREQEERPDWLVDELHLEPGLTVADVGAGSGYLSRRLAPRVAPGTVYAVDVQPEMVTLLAQLAQQPGMSNIAARRGTNEDVGLPGNSVDVAIMVDVYHELAQPYEVVQSIVRALKAGGRMVLVEYRAEDPNVPIKALHKMDESQLRREMLSFPLVWDHTSERLPMQHIIVFRKV